MIRAVEKAILAKLSAATAITNVVSTRIYATQAPLEAPLPYIQFEVASGGSTNRSPRDELDLTVTVRCVAKDTASASGASVAKQMADAIRTALHNATLTLDAPWFAYSCQHLEVIEYVENVDRVQIYYVGGTYRVRAAV